MAKRFNGEVESDIRGSTPAWEPFLVLEAAQELSNLDEDRARSKAG